MLLFDYHKLTSYTATLRFLRTFTETKDGPVIDFLRARSQTALGGRPTIADISLYGYLFWSEEIGVDWAKHYSNIAAWLGRLKALPGWVHPYELMPGHPRAA